MNQRYGGSVAVTEQYRPADAQPREYFGQPNACFLMHVVHSARRIEGRRAAVAVARIDQRAATGRPRQLFGKITPHRNRAQPLMQHDKIDVIHCVMLDETIFDSAAVDAQLVGLHAARSLKRWILPVAVLGSSATNSIQRGYL